MTKRTYVHDDIAHPLEEAQHDTAFRAYRADQSRATIGNPWLCVEALGLRRMPGVKFACIGAGKDAYVGFEDDGSSTGITVRHFTIPARSATVRDAFDANKKIKTLTLWLRKPTKSRTHEARAASNKRRRAEIKAGAPVKRRGKPNTTRIMRIGLPYRPKPTIIKNQVSMDQE